MRTAIANYVRFLTDCSPNWKGIIARPYTLGTTLVLAARFDHSHQISSSGETMIEPNFRAPV
jgi:hypothetical protein